VLISSNRPFEEVDNLVACFLRVIDGYLRGLFSALGNLLSVQILLSNEKNSPLPSARGLPIELRSRVDGGFYASSALLDGCLSTVQQFARLIA
jgi:hypothetical protein